MRMKKDNIALHSALVISLIVLAGLKTAWGGVITGTVYNAETGDPIPYATVRVEQTGMSMAANEAGEYRLMLEPGSYKLKFSHLAFYSERSEVQIADTAIVLDVFLKSARIEVPGITVTASQYGPGQKIMLKAIARRNELFSRIHSYSFEAYAKMVFRTEGAEDSTSILAIMETQHESYWEHPDKFKEVVTAQRQCATMEDVEAYVTTGQILNFNANRIDFIGGEEVVSLTADDALDYYNFYLIDTLFIDSNRVFLLEVEPKSETTPLFAGEITIADSTYDVVGFDVTFNQKISLSMIQIKNIRGIRKGAIFEDEFWMPVELRYEFDLDITIFPIGTLFIDYVAVPHHYHFNFDHPEGTFGDYAFEVNDDAFDRDSAYWEATQLVPLTAEEIGGYRRLDSIAHAPTPLYKQALVLLAQSPLMLMAHDFFHFNRVEGTYVGAAYSFEDLIPRTVVDLGSGYAFGGEFWQHDYGCVVMLSEKRRLKFDFGYHDKIQRRPTVISSARANPTLSAAIDKIDPLDYYLEKGFDMGLSSKIVNHTSLTAKYHDFNHHSVPTSTGFSIFRGSKPHRPNPPIQDGKLRAVSLSFEYDSRRLMRLRGRVRKEYTDMFSRLRVGLEHASPDLIDNDFDYSRYYAELYRAQRTLGLGVTRIKLFAGSSDRILPSQRYFTVDFGHCVLVGDLSFKTLGETNFNGDRAGMAYVFHDLGRHIFKKTGLPLIKHIPFSLGVYGGAFWTDFRDADSRSKGETALVARSAYSELGLRIGKIPPLGFKAFFTWQLSDYPTSDFTFSIGMEAFQF